VITHSNDATNAAYFLYGLEAGVLSHEDAKEWAYSVIEARDSPPIGIIEIAMSKGREQLFKALSSASVEADIPQAGRWLFWVLQQQLEENPARVRIIIQQAIQIANSTQQPEKIYYLFDAVDDDLEYVADTNCGFEELYLMELKRALTQIMQERQL
jgi:hypothetical protein